jgi:hypothetical protein
MAMAVEVTMLYMAVFVVLAGMVLGVLSLLKFGWGIVAINTVRGNNQWTFPS